MFLKDTNIGELRGRVLELTSENSRLVEELEEKCSKVENLRVQTEKEQSLLVKANSSLKCQVSEMDSKISALSETIRKQIEER